MKMIDRMKIAMIDTGVCHGLSAEDLDIAVTAALEAIREPTFDMLDAIYQSENYYVSMGAWRAAIDAALNE